jgi:hypothetical protein
VAAQVVASRAVLSSTELVRWCSYLTGNTPKGIHACYGDSFTFLYVDDIRTSQKTPMIPTAFYGDGVTMKIWWPLVRCLKCENERGL